MEKQGEGEYELTVGQRGNSWTQTNERRGKPFQSAVRGLFQEGLMWVNKDCG